MSVLFIYMTGVDEFALKQQALAPFVSIELYGCLINKIFIFFRISG